MRRGWQVVASLVLLASGAGRAAWGQPPEIVTEQSSVEHVIRTFVPQALERYRVAGASIAIVEDGQVHGLSFGVMDPATNDPIDPLATRFHIASVTKLITALAVVQLAESGRLSIEDPIARHLPPPLAEGLGHAPIRIRHLLRTPRGSAIAGSEWRQTRRRVSGRSRGI